MTRGWRAALTKATAQETSLRPGLPGRTVMVGVPWPVVMAASPVTVQRKVRSALTAAGTLTVRVGALGPVAVAAVAGALMVPAVAAEMAVTVEVAVVVVPAVVTATVSVTAPAASAR